MQAPKGQDLPALDDARWQLRLLQRQHDKPEKLVAPPPESNDLGIVSNRLPGGEETRVVEENDDGALVESTFRGGRLVAQRLLPKGNNVAVSLEHDLVRAGNIRGVTP